VTETPVDPNLVLATPTKDFFISMLIRDIELLDAVADLVDNCVDGARRTQAGDSLKKLWVKIDLSPEHFTISDNCGGIPVNLARTYAFRFGRPDDFPKTKHSIGQFGIGMKRALFKLGTWFSVESSTRTSHFLLEVDVAEWKTKVKKAPDGQSEIEDWDFHFKDLAESARGLKPGTTITVKHLHEGVKTQFGLENFVSRLREKLETTHQFSLAAGLDIRINSHPLKSHPLGLLSSTNIKPAYINYLLPSGIRVRIFAGIAESNLYSAGWNIFCNGRLIVAGDQQERTGWGEGRGKKIPRFHNQYGRFRGYVLFDANDPAILPWNTTKTDVDENNAAYQDARRRMISVMRRVIDFLNELDRANTAAKPKQSALASKVESSVATPLAKIRPRTVFKSPSVSLREAPSKPTQRITYERLKGEIDIVKKALEVRTNAEVGIETFDYYYRVVCKR